MSRVSRGFRSSDGSGAGKTPKTAGMIRHMLDELQQPVKELTAWELGFVASVQDQFSRMGALSDRQFEILEKVYAEKTA